MTKADELRKENERLRAEVERLERILYPPPPEPEPKPAKPTKPVVYLLSDYHQNGAFKDLGRVSYEQVKKKYPEADWRLAYRLDDIPEGADVLLVSNYIGAGFGWRTFPGGNKLHYQRAGKKLKFLPNPDQTKAYCDAVSAVLDGVKELHDLAEETGPRGYGYLLVGDIVMAALKVAEAQFNLGRDYSEAVERANRALTEDRAQISAKLEAEGV